MKFKYLFSAILSAALVCLSSCTDELDTAQYSNKNVTIASYGPNPVMRGATLTFIGSNLDRIVEVQVPGIDPITSIEVVKSGFQSEIRVQLPKDGAEVGVVTLRDNSGNVYSTQSELEFSEPIELESFSAEHSPAMPGDVLTLRGDYLNLVTSVTFQGGAKVEEVTHDGRYTASVVIPANAVTGKIILSDEGSIEADEVANLIYSDDDLVIGDPTVSSVSASSWIPNTTVTISGAYLQMIKAVRFEGDVVVDELSVSRDGRTLMLALPAEAKSGDVVAVSYADKEFVAGTVTMVAPSNLAAAPQPVKAGETLTITGNNLNLVRTVDLPGASGVEFTLTQGNITLTVPAEAGEGEVTLTMANGEQVTVDYTLVVPTVDTVSPVELMAGETISVTGSDLDLVSAVTLGGRTVSFEVAADGNSMTVTTEATSVSGRLVLSLANGETVEPEDEITINYATLIVVSEMPEQAFTGDVVTLKGENFMMIENIYVGDTKVTTYESRSDNEISFVLPSMPMATYTLYFDLLNGDREECVQQLRVLAHLSYNTVWEGNLDITWGNGGRVIVPASSFADVPAGSKINLYYSQKNEVWGQAQMNYGDYTALLFPELNGNQVLVPTDYYDWSFTDRCTDFTLTQEILDNIQARKGDAEDVTDAGFIIQGSDLIFTKIEIVITL